MYDQTMGRIIHFTFIVLAPSLLLSAGLLAHSSATPRCTNPQTETLCRAINEKRLNVTFWGDSITNGQSQIDYPDSWAGLVERHLILSLPKVNVSAVNASIDGAGVGNMRGDDQPVVDGLPWSESVRATRPDLLFIAIGMNSTGDAFSFGQILHERVRFVQSWEVVPTIVLVTPIIPVDREDSPASPPGWVNADAMQIRAIAAEEDLLLADANAAHHFWTEAVEDPARFLSNGATGNGVNHPSDIGHHQLMYTPVERLLTRVVTQFD